MASDSPRTVNGFLVFVGSAAAFIGVIVTVGVLAWNRPTEQTVDQKRAQARLEARLQLEKEATEKIETNGWVDKPKKLVHASVENVIPLVVAELRAKKPAASQVKIDPIMTMPVFDPKSTEPPPVALPSSPQGAETMRFGGPVVEVAPAAPAATAPAPVVPAPAAPAPAPAALPVPAAPLPAPAPTAPVKPAPQPAAPAPAVPAPAVPAPVSAPVTPPVPAPAPASPTPTVPAPVKPAEPAPAAPAPAPAPAAPANAAPSSPNNPTDNSAPTK